MQLRVALCALLLVALPCALAEGFQELFTLDCNGGLTLFGVHDFIKMRLQTPLKPIVDVVLNAIFARGQCYCPSMTANDFDRIFLLGQFLNAIRGPAMDKSIPCASSDWLADHWRDGGIFNGSKFVFTFPPGSCDLATWQSGGNCLIKQSFPSLGLTLNGALKKCPNSFWPYGSVTCSGAGCEKLAMPCNSATECGSPLPCTPLGPVCTSSNRSDCPPDYVFNWTQAEMFNATKDMSLYDSGDVSPGCYAAEKFFEDIISRARLHFRQFTTPYTFQASGVPLNTLRLCMKLDDDYIFSEENTTLDTDVNTSMTIKVMDITCVVRAYAPDPSYSETSCTSLQAWDGQLDAGRGSVTSPSRLDGSFFTEVAAPAPAASEPSAYLLAAHTCEGSIHLLPTNPRLHLSTKVPWLNGHLSWFFGEVFGMQRCRAQARYSDMSWENFRIRFFDIIGMLYQMVLPGPSTPIPSWRLPSMSDWSPNVTTKVVFPSTCTYDSWKNDGICAMQWTGLQSMLKLGITLRFYARTCGSFQLPEFKFECVGSGCSLFLTPQFCSSSSSCPTGAQCIDVYDSLYKDLDSNATIRDIFQAFYTLNTTVEPDTCSNEASGRKFVRDFLRFLGGSPSDGLTDTKICTANFTDIIENFNATLWAEAQATVDGDRVTLHTLLPWTPPVAPVAPVQSSTVSFQITGDSNKAVEVINGDYPLAEVQVTTSGSTITVTVKFTGSNAEPTAVTFASDLLNTNSPLSTKLDQNGVTPQTSTVATNSLITVGPPRQVDSPATPLTLSVACALLAGVVALVSF